MQSEMKTHSKSLLTKIVYSKLIYYILYVVLLFSIT